MTPLRFVVVGAGSIGVRHAQAIAATDGAELAAVVDPHLDRATSIARDDRAAAVDSLEVALDRVECDAIAICTPSGYHGEQALRALRAGKHVVIEKPLDVTADAAARVERAARAARDSGRLATVISQHRFDPASRTVQDAVRAGRFGALTSGVASVAWWRGQEYYDSADWRGTWRLDGGGALMNQSIHTLDLLIWMLGRPVEVTAYTARVAHERIEVEDTAVAAIRFATGALGVLHATTTAYPGLTARLQIHGTHGSAIIDADVLRYFHTADGGDEMVDTVGPPSAGADPSALSSAHELQYADFVDAVATGHDPLVTVADARLTLDVVLAIYESAREAHPVPIGTR
jgi:UDP-N-acetyl-2-amino-2-deoxyglucuronate dehydrogenase